MSLHRKFLIVVLILLAVAAALLVTPSTIGFIAAVALVVSAVGLGAAGRFAAVMPPALVLAGTGYVVATSMSKGVA